MAVYNLVNFTSPNAGVGVNQAGSDQYNAANAAELGFSMNNSTPTEKQFGGIRVTSAVVTAGAEYAAMRFRVLVNGTMTTQLALESTGTITLGPDTNSLSRLTVHNASPATSGNGLFVQSTSTNNAISTASQGAASTALLIGNATITVVSDVRIKDNITAYSADAMALIDSLNVVEFDYKKPNRPFGGYEGRSVGFIAQDLNKVAPWAVHTQGGAECAACLDGEPCDEHPIWMARYEFLIGPIVKGMQDMNARLVKAGL